MTGFQADGNGSHRTNIAVIIPVFNVDPELLEIAIASMVDEMSRLAALGVSTQSLLVRRPASLKNLAKTCCERPSEQLGAAARREATCMYDSANNVAAIRSSMQAALGHA